MLALAVAGSACVAPPPADEYASLDTQVVASVRDPRAATVRIRSTTCQGMGTGSGFLLDANTIVTNRHVVEGATTIDVETYLGEDLKVDVASQGTVADLAILKITGEIGETAVLAEDDPAVGTIIRAFGYAGGGPMRVTEGRVEAYETDPYFDTESPVMMAKLEIRPGNSGGPALNEDDEVIGVVYAIELQTKLAMIVPLSTLDDLLDDEGLLAPVEPC